MSDKDSIVSDIWAFFAIFWMFIAPSGLAAATIMMDLNPFIVSGVWLVVWIVSTLGFHLRYKPLGT